MDPSFVPLPFAARSPAPPGIPAFGAYQCQKCLQVFMEEWHYTQHLQDHAQEEEQMAQLHAAQIPTRVPSPPRKLRCLECGKRFLRPEQFARHTKWHLKLVRLGIKVHHRKVSRRSSQVSYVYKPLGSTRNPPEGKDVSDLPVMQEILGLPVDSPQRTGKRKATKHPKRRTAETWQPQELLSSIQAGNSMAVLDGATGINLLQPWQKQEGVLEGQVAGGLFQPAVMSAENQIIILDGDEAEAVPVAAEQHYAELQASVFDSQAATNAVQPVFLRTEEQAAILEPPVSTNPLQAGGVKDQEATSPEWVSQKPCTVYRTVLLQADDQAAVVDSQTEPGPFQQVIIKTSEVSPTLYLDPQMSSLGPAAFHLVPEPQYITFPYGNSLPLDHSEATNEGEKAWESQEASFCLPNLYQASKQQQQPPSATTTSPQSPVVMRLLPCPTGDHPEVLDLEYDTGGGIPVASEPWDVNLHAGQETPSSSPAAEDGFIVVEMESELGQQGLVVGEHHDRPGNGPSGEPESRPFATAASGGLSAPTAGSATASTPSCAHTRRGGNAGEGASCANAGLPSGAYSTCCATSSGTWRKPSSFAPPAGSRSKDTPVCKGTTPAIPAWLVLAALVASTSGVCPVTSGITSGASGPACECTPLQVSSRPPELGGQVRPAEGEEWGAFGGGGGDQSGPLR
ncbi:hypothetical protein E2320_000629 [Naja naja]|nr:hypothetical protein E2320_000629 [Naja naja]